MGQLVTPGPDFQGHVFVRPLQDPDADPTCQRCGWAFSTFESKPVGCPGQRQFDPGVDPGLPDPAETPAPEAPVDDLEGLTDSERIGVAVAAMVDSVVQQRENAREWAARLEGSLAEATKHLRALVAVLAETGTTFAHHADMFDQANEFLDEGIGSPETPDQPGDAQ